MKLNVLIVVMMMMETVENRMMPLFQATKSILDDDMTLTPSPSENHLAKKLEEKTAEKILVLNTYDYHDEYNFEAEKEQKVITTKKPWAIVVMPNLQNPNEQSLLRKYRYDANGLLIPSSVQYFIKLRQGVRQAPVVVPLNSKAFSPLGGFVRYYKVVPPIPRAWQR